MPFTIIVTILEASIPVNDTVDAVPCDDGNVLLKKATLNGDPSSPNLVNPFTTKSVNVGEPPLLTLAKKKNSC